MSKILISCEEGGQAMLLDALIDQGVIARWSGIAQVSYVDDELYDAVSRVLRRAGLEVDLLERTPIAEQAGGAWQREEDTSAKSEDISIGEAMVPAITRMAGALEKMITGKEEQGAVSAETAAPVNTQETSELRRCEVCGEAFIPKQKNSRLCGKAECKKADMHKRYQAEYAARKNDHPAGEEEPAADPFEGAVEGFVWREAETPSFFSMEGLLAALEAKSLAVGTRLMRRGSNLAWEVFDEGFGLRVREIPGGRPG